MMVDNEFTKLGMKLRIIAILTLVAGVLGFVDDLLPISISGFVSIPLLVFQIMVIIGAKRCAKVYNKAELNTFGAFMIVSLVTSFAAVGVIFAMSYMAVLSVLLGGGSPVINILPIIIVGQVISIISLAFETMAWFNMLGFFNHLDEIDVRARGTPGAILVAIGSLVSVASALVVSIPAMLSNPTINLETMDIVMNPGQAIVAILFTLGTLVVTIPGYFILSNALVQLGNLRPPSAAYGRVTAESNASPRSTPAGEMPWDKRDVPGSARAGAWDGGPAFAGPDAGARAAGSAGTMSSAGRPDGSAGPGTTDPGRCPGCGASLVTTDPRAMFCGECGARLPGRE